MTSPSMRHLQGLQALLEALAGAGIEMEKHEYDQIAFGSFTLVVAKGHERVRFLWDGKESILTVESTKVQGRTVAGAWTHDAFIKVDAPAAVFAEIGSEATSMLR